MARGNLFSDFMRVRFTNKPNPMDQVPVKSDDEDIVSKLEDAEASGTSLQSMAALDEFRTLAQDRQSQYNAYDEMATDSVIAAALESYADDATVEDEQGRVIWVESESKEIADSANRLLDILEIPERAWKHIYMACKYGDYYLKFNRVKQDENAKPEDKEITLQHSSNVKIVNDKEIYQNTRYTPTYEEYIEDMPDPAVIFDLQEHGKTAGFIEVHGSENDNVGMGSVSALTYKFQKNDVKIYPADAMIHIAISETMNRTPETVTLQFDENTSTTYDVKRGKSTLYDVYPIERTVQLLEDSLSLNRLTRSSIIRILEVEVGNKPQNEINATLRRVKNSIEQKIAMDKNAGRYQSYQSPGPIDNILYFPTKNGKGSINVNTIGGDVNVRDIADIDYFNNKRAAALKIPKAYLGEDMEGSGLSNGGSLTRQSIKYARVIQRIQRAYIRAITTMLNLFFYDKGLDYINKFEVRMTSPSTQEDLERNELVNGNIDLVKNIMDLTDSLEGDTQKKVLVDLINNVMKMPDIASIIKEDTTPEEEIDIDVTGGGGGAPSFAPSDLDEGPIDMSNEFEAPSTEFESETETTPSGEEEFTDQEYQNFMDNEL